jgi:hypothetical protein
MKHELKKSILASISLPYHLKDSYPTAFYINVTTYFDESSNTYDYDNLTYNLQKLGINNLIIITVNKHIKDTIEKTYVNAHSITKNYIVPINEFFSEKGIEKYLLHQDLEINIKAKVSRELETIKKIKPRMVIYKF